MRRNPERLAWTVLLASFGACVALTIAVPLGAKSFIDQTTEPLDLILDVQQGTALLRRPNSTDVVGVAADADPMPIAEGSTIRVDGATQAVLTARLPHSDVNLAVVQLYGNTVLGLPTATQPRFEASSNPYRFDMELEGGRIRASVLDDLDRPAIATVQSPQGRVLFGKGTYAVEVSNDEMQVTAREGQATVDASGVSVVIEPSQRARVQLGQPPEGGLSGERPLVVDGSFAQLSSPAWIVQHDLQDSAEAEGVISYGNFGGQRAAVFERSGQSHAETRLSQNINRDVSGAASLILHFSLLLNSQDVPVCGTLGSECPMMVKINYRDDNGTQREWLQGFYYLPDVNPGTPNPDFCVTCATRNPHLKIPANSWYSYDSGNLMDALAAEGVRPARIDSITFYASGHSYRSALTDVEVLVQD